MKIYWKNRLIQSGAARIVIGDAAFFMGSALAEAMLVSAGKAVDFEMHFARLCEGARVLMMPQPSKAVLKSACSRLIRANRLREGSLRLRYFRDGALLIHPFPLRKVNPGLEKEGIRLLTTAVRHYGPDSVHGRVKANSMLPNWLAKAEAGAWAEDGLRMTPAGYVAEGVWSNIVIEKKGLLLTPPLSEGILEGTVRGALIKKWKKAGKKVKEIPLTRHDLYTADKVWMCSSLRGALKVREVDGRKIGV